MVYVVHKTHYSTLTTAKAKHSHYNYSSFKHELALLANLDSRAVTAAYMFVHVHYQLNKETSNPLLLWQSLISV